MNSNHYNKETQTYICDCGKEFKSKRSLSSHARFCTFYIKEKKETSYKINEGLYRCECGKEFSNPQSLNAHFSHCSYHHSITGKEQNKRPHLLSKKMSGWENKTQQEIQEIRRRSAATKEKNRKEGKYKNNEYYHSTETISKIKEGTFNYLNKCSPIKEFKPRYSKTACSYIKGLNEKMGWELQHAEQGGEKQIGRYFVDGFDPFNKVIFEYDEKRHYKGGVLKNKDVQRMYKIQEKFPDYTFIRYNEKEGTLYKVIEINETSYKIEEINLNSF